MTLSSLLPAVVERELRVASRRNTTYWNRFGAAATGLIIAAWILMAQMALTTPAQAGQFVFRLLAGVAAFAVVGSVLRSSSAAFAREKREDTLGLLFLTPLRPFDIALGKLVATALPAFYEFLAVVPLLALPILLGGVRLVEFGLLVVALVNWVFVSATLGLLVSAVSWDEKRAAAAASAWMIALTALFPLCVTFLAVPINASGAMGAWALSPAYPVWAAVMPKGAAPLSFWASIGWSQFLGWMFFLLTCQLLPRCWQRSGSKNVAEDPVPPATANATIGTPPPSQPKKRRLTRIHLPADERARRLDVNPMYWLSSTVRPATIGLWGIIAIGLLVMIPAFITIISSSDRKFMLSPEFALFVFYCVNAGMKCFVATQASFTFARDRGEDTLELLLTTPLTSRELIDGERYALHSRVRRWVFWMLSVETAWLILTFMISPPNSPGLTGCLALAVVGFLIPDLHAVSWSAAWRSVTANNAREANRTAANTVLALPWFITGFFWLVMIVNGPSENDLLGLVMLWMVMSGLVNGWQITTAKRELENNLYAWAQRRAAGEFENYDRWRRWGRALAYFLRGKPAPR